MHRLIKVIFNNTLNLTIMSFALIIFMRVLFAACMVFIIGSVFGSFSKRPALKVISKISAILVIVLFIGMNIFFVRAAFGGRWRGGGHAYNRECRFGDKETFLEGDSFRERDNLGPEEGQFRQGQDSLQRR